VERGGARLLAERDRLEGVSREEVQLILRPEVCARARQSAVARQPRTGPACGAGCVARALRGSLAPLRAHRPVAALGLSREQVGADGAPVTPRVRLVRRVGVDDRVDELA